MHILNMCQIKISANLSMRIIISLSLLFDRKRKKKKEKKKKEDLVGLSCFSVNSSTHIRKGQFR